MHVKVLGSRRWTTGAALAVGAVIAVLGTGVAAAYAITPGLTNVQVRPLSRGHMGIEGGGVDATVPIGGIVKPGQVVELTVRLPAPGGVTFEGADEWDALDLGDVTPIAGSRDTTPTVIRDPDQTSTIRVHGVDAVTVPVRVSADARDGDLVAVGITAWADDQPSVRWWTEHTTARWIVQTP